MASLRQAINRKCAECTYDPLDTGTRAQQIACCTLTMCPLHAVRPITATVIPMRLLNAFGIQPNDLCERARPLVESSPPGSSEGQNERLLDVKPSTNSEVAA